MVVLITFFTFIFILIGFLESQFVTRPHGVFSAYFLTMWDFVLNNAFVFILCFFVGTIGFLKSVKFDNSYSFNKKFVFSGIHVLTASFLGFFMAFIMFCTIAIIQLNTYSIIINTNKEILGITNDKKEIINALKENSRPPEIIATDKDPYKELLAISAAASGKTNFYGAMILTSIPNFLVIPHGTHDSSVILLDNTLIVSEIKQSDIGPLSPFIGHLLLKHNFPTRKIKTYPKVSLMDKSKYQEFRRQENVHKLAKIDDELQIITAKISSVSASLESDNSLLEINKISGSKKVSGQNLSINELKKNIENGKNLLNEYRYLEKFYVTQKQLLQSLTIDASPEQAAFIPPDEIKIVYKTNNPHAIADYFATLVHEYLHYASYISENKMLADSFFEEGLTEYFARSAIKNDLNTSTNLGYPVQAKIISEMTNLIPESEFAQIYFSKDQEGLEKALDRVYGDGFYLENKISFETLQYAYTPNRILYLANDIMKKIGGKMLTEEDLNTTFSKL